MELWVMVPGSPVELSLCGGETESLSSEHDDATSDSSEESSSDESSETAPGKRAEWEAHLDGGVGEMKGGVIGEEDGEFEPAPAGRRACRRLEKQDQQRENESERVQRQVREKECAAKDLELQRETLARAAKARQEAEAKGPAEGAG